MLQTATLPDTIGEIPLELRGVFDQQMPTQSYFTQGDYRGDWWFGDAFTDDALHADIRHHFPIIEHAVQLGGLSLQPDTVLVAKVQQCPVYEFPAVGIGWHEDVEFDETYRRLVASNMHGTWYLKDGEEEQALPYDYLLIDSESSHKADEPESNDIRTRLQLTLLTSELYRQFNRL